MTSTGRQALGIVLLCLAVPVGCCGLGILAYGGLGAIMVHESHEDPWVTGSLAVGAVVSVLAVAALIAGTVVLIRRRR